MATTLEFDDFDQFRGLIYAKTGNWLGDSKATFLQMRLDERMQARGISSVREYYHFLKYDPAREEDSNI